MKALVVLALSSLCVLAIANEQSVAAAENTSVETYTYESHPDIAKVVSTTPIAHVCAVVPMRMTYEDHQGQTHVMAYQVMGSGCSS